MNRDTVKDLTLMLMYLTSWEESLVPGLRKNLTVTVFIPRPVFAERIRFWHFERVDGRELGQRRRPQQIRIIYG